MNPKYNPQAHRPKPPQSLPKAPAAEKAISRPPTLAEELQRLGNAANKGHAAALTQLRQLLEQHPEITSKLGNLVQHAKETQLRRISNNEPLLGESIRLELERLKQDLLPPNPRAVHLLAVEWGAPELRRNPHV